MNNLSASPLSRRQFLRRSAAGAAAVSLGALAPDVLAQGKKPTLGVQLYSVRDQCKQDFPGTIKTVAGIGYKGVEFAGYYGRSAKELRRMLDDNGLVACGTHTAYETVKPNQLEQTIEFNRIIGNPNLIVPSMTANSRADWIKRADEFNQISEKLRPHDMRVGYHSHQQDFKTYAGEISWDIFGYHTSVNVTLELDTGNCAEGGGHPLEELKKFPGRTRSIHIKAFGGGPEAVIGEDKLPWPEIFKWCNTEGGTEWYVLEHETSSDPVHTIRRSYEALKKYDIA
jgi:sugar phosphate isomerase/epimerase